MNKSDSIVKIAGALLAAQKEIGSALKGSSNPFFKSKYADLGAVMEACKEPLNKNGITVLQPVNADADGEYVETILLHESGEFLSSRMKLLVPKNMQDYGSAVSYARRYSLQSLVFIPAEDDDGETTMGRKSNGPAKEASPERLVDTETLPTKRSSFKKPSNGATAEPTAPASTNVDGWD